MKRIIKITVDIIMTLLFFVLMAYHFTGDAIHEYLGFSLFIFFILHHILNFNILNFNWYKNIYKGKYNFNRILNTFINTMLFLCMLGLMISGILFSQRVLGFLNIHNSGMFTRRLHMISNSWAFVFMSAHLGMHWGMFINKNFIKKQISIIIALFVSIYGVVSFIKRGLYNKMFLLVEFAFFDYEEPVIFFFMDYVSIMVLFIFITYCLKKISKG